MARYALDFQLSFDELLYFHCVKLSKCGVFSGPHFPVFSPNTGKYGPEITPYLDIFHAVFAVDIINKFQTFLSLKSPVVIYKSFIRPHLDYRFIIYDQAFYESFQGR